MVYPSNYGLEGQWEDPSTAPKIKPLQSLEPKIHRPTLISDSLTLNQTPAEAAWDLYCATVWLKKVRERGLGLSRPKLNSGPVCDDSDAESSGSNAAIYKSTVPSPLPLKTTDMGSVRQMVWCILNFQLQMLPNSVKGSHCCRYRLPIIGYDWSLSHHKLRRSVVQRSTCNHITTVCVWMHLYNIEVCMSVCGE